ncbi:MAG TPA: hypothetical protein VHL57_03200 [Flavobacteriales bacterium]|jgi:hypothetical protein|nr:hypothetical protein [Flavobacteriales bacterium]
MLPLVVDIVFRFMCTHYRGERFEALCADSHLNPMEIQRALTFLVKRGLLRVEVSADLGTCYQLTADGVFVRDHMLGPVGLEWSAGK